MRDSESTKEELSKLPFMNPDLDLEERVHDLLGRLTLDEKFTLSAGKNFWNTKPVKRMEIKPFGMADGPFGVGPHYTLKRCTYFPVSICLGASWDIVTAEEFGQVLAEETRAANRHMILGPGVNICRTPLNGRTFEYFTEDPCLNKTMVVPVVKGIQSKRIAACVKHFAANNQETKRTSVSVEVSERALREIYLPAFEGAVKEADAWSLMACYNRLNGVYGCENRSLLVDRLKGEYGFRGFVVSDWYAARKVESTEKCIHGGLGLEMPGGGIKYKQKEMRKAFEQGKFREADLDKNLKGLLRVMFLVGQFDPQDMVCQGRRNTPDHQLVARKIAEQGITLLKNSEKLLPLDIDKIKNLAVIGPNAKKKMGQFLYGGSSGVWPPYEITPFRGLQIKGKGRFKVIGSPSKADAVVIVAGLNHWMGNDCEGKDRKDLALPKKQIDLINETARANANTIVVLINGGPLAMGGWIENVSAVVEAWYPGMEGGHVIADILFGDINPSGKLPVTFPKRLADSPAHASSRTFPGDDRVYYDEGIFIGYRHFDTYDIEPLFPFGHGLSYTSFEYNNLQMQNDNESEDIVLKVSVDINNSGERAGAEIVQLYVQDVESSVKRPRKELKGFQKINLDRAETATITFCLKKQDLSFFNEDKNCWTAEAGLFNILVGSSSRDIRRQGKFEYKG